MPLLLFTVPILSTLLGGFLAIRFRRYHTPLIAIGAGILLGAAFLDILPEAISLGITAGLTSANVLALTLLSFLLFHGLDAALDALGREMQGRSTAGVIVHRAAASMLVFHSFRDGMAIGAAYSAAHSAGFAVAAGIAAHDLGDGMNTVILASGDGTPSWATGLFLAADALAPFLGGLLTAWWTLSPRASVVLLALAAGFFLQMATGDFLPELKRSDGPRRFLLPSVLLGVGLIYLANLLIAHER